MIKNFVDYLNLDYKRDNYLRNGDVDRFLKSYNVSLNTKNGNTTLFWDKKLNRENGEDNPMFVQKIKTVFNYISDKKGRLLDVGIGNGKLEEKIINYNSNIDLYGIDISNSSIKNANLQFAGLFKKGSILKIPFKSNMFDIVTTMDVLEHLPVKNTFSALNEVNRVLKKKGCLIVSIPINEGLLELVERGLNPNEHLRIYTKRIIYEELKQTGFCILNIRYLYAFHSLYKLKSLIVRLLPFLKIKPNLIIIYAKKK